MAEKFDIAIIGSGPGGYRAAVLAALRGRKAAVVEKGDWGGCCLNRGCVPKKAWYHTARLVRAAGDFEGRGIDGTLKADIGRAWTHQEGVVGTVQASYLDYMKRLGVTAIAGTARLAGGNRVAVTNGEDRRTIDADFIVIATGSRPIVPPPLAGLPDRVITTDRLFDAPPPPGDRVAVVGGGVIATEFAFILAMLGKEVLWLTRRPPLARSLFSRQAQTGLQEALAAAGVAPRIGTEIAGASLEGGRVVLRLADGGREEVDWALLGTGRAPVTEGLDLAGAGVALHPNGFVQTDAWLQTTVPGIYAIGDCVGPAMTANQALADATTAVHNMLEGNSRPRETLWVPEVVYSALELARVGMNEDLAEEAELEPAVGFAAFGASPEALGRDEAVGFVRVIGDLDSGALLGGEVAGGEAGELIHLLSLAPDRATALTWLAEGRFNHPTRAEEFLNATETLAMKWGLAERVFGGQDPKI